MIPKGRRIAMSPDAGAGLIFIDQEMGKLIRAIPASEATRTSKGASPDGTSGASVRMREGRAHRLKFAMRRLASIPCMTNGPKERRLITSRKGLYLMAT
jgi:hypothetical protein